MIIPYSFSILQRFKIHCYLSCCLFLLLLLFLTINALSVLPFFLSLHFTTINHFFHQKPADLSLATKIMSMSSGLKSYIQINNITSYLLLWQKVLFLIVLKVWLIARIFSGWLYFRYLDETFDWLNLSTKTRILTDNCTSRISDTTQASMKKWHFCINVRWYRLINGAEIWTQFMHCLLLGHGNSKIIGF